MTKLTASYHILYGSYTKLPYMAGDGKCIGLIEAVVVLHWQSLILGSVQVLHQYVVVVGVGVFGGGRDQNDDMLTFWRGERIET